MNQEELLKLFHKYGFSSFKKEPFLYEKNGKLGILYVVKDPFYGNLKRLFLPKDLEEAEDFLAKYSWWKKYGSKYHITMKCDDYKIENPKVSFCSSSKSLTIDELRDLLKQKEDKKKDSDVKEENYFKKLKRTVMILVKVLQAKVKNIETTFENYQQLQKDYEEKEKILADQIEKYEKKKEKESIEELTFPENVFSFNGQELIKESQNLDTKEKLENYIYHFVDVLKSLETDDDFLQKKYELIRFPLLIEMQKEKLECVKDAFKKKKGIFGKKENLAQLLEEIEKKSTIQNIVSFDHFKENEKKRIDEKYAVIPDLDIRTIGDYFLEFDNLKIEMKEEKQEENPLKIEDLSYEDVMKSMESSYEKKPKAEQDFFITYFYLLKNVWREDTISSLKEFMNLLENPNNIMIQVKYFKEINFQDENTCLNSIKKVQKKLSTFESDNLPGTINVFFKDQKSISPVSYLKTSSKRNLAPIQIDGENDITYIATLKKGAAVYFIPEEIIPDVENDELLVLQGGRPYFLCDMKKNTIKEEKSDILKVVEYSEEKETQGLITVVTNLKSKKIHLFKYITIERKKENV